MNDRREFVKRGALAGLGALACARKGAGAASPQPLDKLEQRALDRLKLFTDWLAANGAKGFIGEVGFPGDRRKLDKDNCGETPQGFRDDYRKWNRLAETWFRKADEAKLWATIWATGEWWGDYTLAVYKKTSDEAESINTTNTQSVVFERHLTTDDYERGITVAGGEFAAHSGIKETLDDFSNVKPGCIEHEYHYDNQATFNYLASRGVTLARIPFRWERIQPRLGGGLDPNELVRLKGAVERARRSRENMQRKMKVILDVHNFGAYYDAREGEVQGRRRDFREPGFGRLLVDLWTRLSAEFKATPGVCYGLMCEPVDPLTAAEGRRTAATAAWETACREIVDKLRAAGDTQTIIVSGYLWSGVHNWAAQHERGWVRDPLNKVLYEAHQYWDADASGHYCLSYDAELARR